MAPLMPLAVARDFPNRCPQFQNLLKKCQKLLFETEVAHIKSSVLKNLLPSSSIWFDAKICKLYNKSKISKYFCAILGREQRW